ncbi:MAG: hypothetical protein H7Z18_04765 [Methylophilaceae bacterium]|nr:hypothetical protein [Methylophilaceae bacterium]
MNEPSFLNWPVLQWQIKQFSKQIGLLGLVGLSLMLVSLSVYLFTTLPAQRQLESSILNLAEIKQSSRQLTLKAHQDERDPVADMAEFYAAFPKGASLSSSLRLIQQTALQQKLELNRGDYKLTLAKPANANGEMVRYELLRYEVQLPVSGQYPQMRAFINGVMQKIPNLALSEIQMKRENSLLPTVEARLLFVMFVKGDAW